MPIYLRQSTASQEIILGYFLDSTDGNTEETGLTIANTDIKLWKNGATTLANKNSGGATHISNGLYYAVLDATDTATVGPMVIFCHPTGSLVCRLETVVLTAKVYDSLIAGTDNLEVDLIQWLGTAPLALSSQRVQTSVAAIGASVITATSIDSNAITSAKIATDAIGAAQIAANAIGASELAADAVTEIQSGLATSSALATVDSNVDAILVDTGTTIPSTLSTIEGKIDTVDTNVDSILVDTGTDIPATLATIDGNVDSILVDTGTTIPTQISGLNDVSSAEVQSACDSAITANTDINNIDTGVNNIEAKLPTNYIMGSSDQTDKDDDIDAILVDTGTTLPATLTTIEGKIDTIDTNVDAVLVDTGTTIPAQISGLNDISSADVTTACESAITNREPISANITQISDDAVAAQNLELDYDGTGYSKTNSSLGTVSTTTNVTNQVSADVTAISGDTTAANNLELDYDGTGYNKANSTVGTVTDVTNTVEANVTQLGGSAQSATDLKDFSDDGYDPATNQVNGVKTVETVTNVTNQVTANVTAISGDTTAADNLEATYDGTGYINDSAPAQQQQVNNLSVGSSAISKVSSSRVLTTGSEANSYTDTHTLNGTYHEISDSAGTTDIYYEFLLGGSGVPSSVTVVGRSTGLNDPMNVYGYNWGTTSWEQIGIMPGASSDSERTFSMYTTHIGTGTDLGKVRVRFANTGLTTAVLYIDQLYVSYAVISQSVGYANGAIWVDTNGSNTNTEDYIDGVADNPVSTWAAALTLSSSLGIKKFEIINGSSITLSGNSDNYTLTGANWTLALNGQSVANAVFIGAEVTGTCTGSSYQFEQCKLGDGGGVTFGDGFCIACAISGNITLTAAGTYYFDQCFSGVAGTSTPYIDFGAAVGNTNVNFRHYSGGIEVQNLGQSGTDNMSLEGYGQYVVNANCTGGTIAVRGAFKKTDNSNGAVTISDDANYKSDIIHFGFAQGSGTGNNQIQLATTASATNGAYDPAKVFIVSGTGAGQSRLILQYDGATKTATVDRNWKVNPSTDSEYRIVADIGREHINEGLAQAGTSNTITLNALASSSDNAYNGQIVFLRSGTGEDQAAVVTGYNGTTKVATIDGTWATNPDTTTGYVMIPCMTVTQTSIDDVASDVTDIIADTNEMQGKLPTNNIMGSSVKTDKDDEIDAILADTADMQPKLGTPSADISADIAAVKVDTGNIETDTQDIQSTLGTPTDTDIATDISNVQTSVDSKPVIKKNTAYNNYTFAMIDSADGVSFKTGLTVTAQRSIDGASFGACSNSVSEIANGVYKINLAASDVNGDNVMLRFTASGALDLLIQEKPQP